ncbi:HAMP domain-containing sensor histidine kinase [Ruthenibacterium sp. CLA-JM-H11]|uniref:histidine kinase n=1 Tax=Ruthenibacterium intestinale TaxID=3133163 RepID=A0ABV1GIM3_9FIRM
MQKASLAKETLRNYMETVVLAQDIASLLECANRAWERLFPGTVVSYWVKNGENWIRIKSAENDEIRFEKQAMPFSNEADGLLRELQTQRLFSDVLLLKLFCGDFHWGVVALSPVEGGVEEECLAVSEKLTMLLAQQLLPMLEKLSPRDTALNLLRKDALILLAEEIKTPLTVASAAAQTVEAKLHYAQQTELEERCRRLLQVLDQNLRKAIRVSDNVLEVGRLESGYAQPEWQAFDLNDFLRELFEQVMPYTMNESVDFFYQNTLSNPQIVVSDMEYIERILLNLVSNAIKGCRRCGRRGEIHVTAAVREEQMVVTVRDNGVGIAREDLPHVFEKFWQPSDSNGELRGTGMGLYLSSLLARQLSGKLWAESAQQGACFTLCVPIRAKSFPVVTSHKGAIRKEVLSERVKTELCEFLPVSQYR